VACPGRRFAVVGLLVALTAPASTALDGMARVGGPSPELVLDVMNAHRERRGLPKLRMNRKLNAAAEDRIRDLFRRRYFEHVAPDGTPPDAWVRRRGYDYTRIGENLATGQPGAREAVDQWMRSRGHRATLLGSFEDAGIAIAEGSPTSTRKRGYTFVALFGREE
jgi:uncharacterized protein YkwD